MISGYLPFLIHLILLVAFWGGIGAIDGWLLGAAKTKADQNRLTLVGFFRGCGKGIGFLVLFILMALSLPVLIDMTR